MTHFLIVSALGLTLAISRTHYFAIGFCSIALMLCHALVAVSFGAFSLGVIGDIFTLQVSFFVGLVAMETAIDRWPTVFGKRRADQAQS